MKCKMVMQRFLELDNNERMPIAIKWHTLFCSSCNKEIANLQQTLFSLQNTSSFDIENDLSNKIVSQLDIFIKNPGHLSFFRWVVVGALLLTSIFLISFNDILIWYFGKSLQIMIYLIMGFVISIYTALFVSAHLDEAKEISNYLQKKESS